MVVDPGDGLTVQAGDGTQHPAQAGEQLTVGDRLITSQPAGQPVPAHPATIRWLAGGMSQLFDAEPRIFVAGPGPTPRAQTTADIDVASTPIVRVLGGFVRFWFPAGQPSRYSFQASTQVVSAATTGTDFTIGYDPARAVSTVGVTRDAVTVTPLNPTLRPFSLAAGSEVEVSADRVGAITPLADQTTANEGRAGHRSGRSHGWLVGVVAAIVLALSAAAVVLVSRKRRRRRAEANRPTEQLLVDPFSATGQRDVHSSGHDGVDRVPTEATSDPLPVITRNASRSSDWYPTHRVTAPAVPARAIPDDGASDVAVLEEGLEVRLVERRGDWANVAAANGWSGWVDTHGLEPDDHEPSWPRARPPRS